MYGTRLIAGGQAPELLTSIDEPRDAMAPTVEGSIARPRATCLLGARDGGPHATLASIRPTLPATVPLIAHHARRATRRAAWPTALDGPGRQACVEDQRLVSRPRREPQGHQRATPFGPEVDGGPEAAPATAEGLGLGSPFLAPAAWWWARIMGPSTSWPCQVSWPSASAWAGPAAQSRPQRPVLDQW